MILNSTQTLLDEMDINGSINEAESAVDGASNNERELLSQIIEQNNNVVMLENNSNKTSPATATVQQSPHVIENKNMRVVVIIVHKCEWYNYNNVDNIILVNEKVLKKKWDVCLHSGKILYQNSIV